ncbi:hypothetical protein [Halopenitus persicus]|uniref:Uncharacterized protein n=1 Tax=Halopenitus persicus TaxID=1048396 RepID=A0A1H3E865_9EURY|nr:hypothetical protein [Halopenitus persicus]SDX74845.1 hypothetical protein SAMN05216564_101324 [Halopenitus persicus]
MSPSNGDGSAALPTFAALDTRAVLERERRGASIQLDTNYFRGQELALQAVEASSITERRNVASRSREFYRQIQVDFDSFTRENLESASAKFRRVLQQIPEVQYLKRNFPETCFVVPEWLRAGGNVNYGGRLYFFRDEDAPEPTEILQRNIEAVMNDDRAGFEQYQGVLHGYPACCVDYFSDYERRAETGPELEAVETIADCINTDMIRDDVDRSVSIEEIVDGIFEIPQVYAFFTREFYPEPRCERARRQGVSIYETLCKTYPEDLVKDHFRINVAWSYLMAKATMPENRQTDRPVPGSLGREHLLFYLPLSMTVTTPQYRRD